MQQFAQRLAPTVALVGGDEPRQKMLQQTARDRRAGYGESLEKMMPMPMDAGQQIKAMSRTRR